MNQPTKATAELAQRILAMEAHETDPSHVYVGLRVIENLRHSLTRYGGSLGFQPLLAHALALAKAQVSWLETVQVETDGSMTGFQEAAMTRDIDDIRKGETVLLANVLGHLVTFIGEAATLNIVRDVWSDARLDDFVFESVESI